MINIEVPRAWSCSCANSYSRALLLLRSFVIHGHFIKWYSATIKFEIISLLKYDSSYLEDKVSPINTSFKALIGRHVGGRCWRLAFGIECSSFSWTCSLWEKNYIANKIQKQIFEILRKTIFRGLQMLIMKILLPYRTISSRQCETDSISKHPSEKI